MENLPLDLLYPVLSHLDRRDLTNVVLVNSTFNRVATPLLYWDISSRVCGKKVLLRPCFTLLQRPGLAQYVRKVTETSTLSRSCMPASKRRLTATSGTVQRFRRVNPQIIKDITTALRLCTNLVSATYTDDTDTPTLNFSPILQVLITLPLKELVIRTHHDVGEDAWALLNKIKGLRHLSVWSLNSGPPRVLQGWADEFTSTLTHLELGRCAGVPPTILISVFLKLPLLHELTLKGVPKYLGVGNYRMPSTTLPALEKLTVRTGSVDVLGPDRLWSWMASLLPHAGSLKSFTLNAFSIYGRMAIPWPFVAFLTTKQGRSLQGLDVGAAILNLHFLSELCLKCPVLKTVQCTVASPDVESIAKAVANGKSLGTLSLHVMWIEQKGMVGPSTSDFCDNLSGDSDKSTRDPLHVDYSSLSSEGRLVEFTLQEARSMMLRPGSKLRAIRFGASAYIGQWVLADTKSARSDNQPIFEAVRDITR